MSARQAPSMLQVLLLIAPIWLHLACEPTGGRPRSPGEATASVERDTITVPETAMRAGDSVRFELDYVTRGTPVGAKYIVETDLSASLDISVATEARPNRSDLIVRGPLRPGIYSIPVEVTSPGEGVLSSLELSLVVVPAVPSPTAAVADLAAGALHTLALLENGEVWAWGRNHRYQLGDGSRTDRNTPVRVLDLPGPAVAIAAGEAHSLVVLEDGTVWAWGENEHRQVSATSDAEHLSPVRVTCNGEPCRIENVLAGGPLQNVVAIAAGREHSLALDDEGGVWTWGNSADSRLGHRFNRASRLEIPVQIEEIAAGRRHSLALDVEGTVWGWGSNGFMQLGFEETGDVEDPVQLPRLFRRGIVTIAAGAHFSLAVESSGRVLTAGDDGFAQLGDPGRESDFFEFVPNLFNVVDVAAGFAHALALRADGTVMAWGENSFHQLGFPEVEEPTIQSTPALAQELPPAEAIVAGWRHSMARVGDCLWGFGDNVVGQLGDGTSEARRYPVGVDGLGEVAGSCGVPLTVYVDGRGEVRSSSTLR